MKKLLLLFVVVLMVLPTFARDFTYTYNGKTLKYTVIDENAKTCQTAAGRFYYGSSPADFHYEAGNDVSGNLVIPSVAKDGGREYTVTSIGEYAFYGCSYLTSVTIPNSVTSIGFRAFLWLYLEGRERQGTMRNNGEDYSDLQGIMEFNALAGVIWK